MFKTADEVLKFIKDEDIKFVDIRFTDLPGVQQHFNVPAKSVDADFFVNGQLFDGSSIRGFQGIAESDMQLIPDVTTAFIDTFRMEKTLALNFSIVNPRTGDPYHRDPRGVAEKAEAYLASTGIADTAFFAPEAEFFVFDNVQYQSSPQGSFYKIDSEEAHWNTGARRRAIGSNLCRNETTLERFERRPVQRFYRIARTLQTDDAQRFVPHPAVRLGRTACTPGGPRDTWATIHR